jgi:hypothetical protein
MGWMAGPHQRHGRHAGRCDEAPRRRGEGLTLQNAAASATAATAAVELLRWFRRLKRFGGVVAALFSGPMATYTAVLLANTAVPFWHAFHTQLPFVSFGSARRPAVG